MSDWQRSIALVLNIRRSCPRAVPQWRCASLAVVTLTPCRCFSPGGNPPGRICVEPKPTSLPQCLSPFNRETQNSPLCCEAPRRASCHFAVVAKGWKGTLPAGVKRIEAPTPTCWIIVRTQTNGPKDYEAVHQVQDGYKVNPLEEVDSPGVSCLLHAALSQWHLVKSLFAMRSWQKQFHWQKN